MYVTVSSILKSEPYYRFNFILIYSHCLYLLLANIHSFFHYEIIKIVSLLLPPRMYEIFFPFFQIICEKKYIIFCYWKEINFMKNNVWIAEMNTRDTAIAVWETKEIKYFHIFFFFFFVHLNVLSKIYERTLFFCFVLNTISWYFVLAFNNIHYVWKYWNSIIFKIIFLF